MTVIITNGSALSMEEVRVQFAFNLQYHRVASTVPIGEYHIWI